MKYKQVEHSVKVSWPDLTLMIHSCAYKHWKILNRKDWFLYLSCNSLVLASMTLNICRCQGLYWWASDDFPDTTESGFRLCPGSVLSNEEAHIGMQLDFLAFLLYTPWISLSMEFCVWVGGSWYGSPVDTGDQLYSVDTSVQLFSASLPQHISVIQIVCRCATGVWRRVMYQ